MSRFLAARWNGEAVAGGRIAIDAGDRGLTLGDGLFETLPVLGGAPVWIEDHLDRMAAAANLIGIPVKRAVIEAEVRALLEGRKHGILRITLTRGAGGRGLGLGAGEPGLLLTLAPWIPGLIGEPMTVAIAETRRNEGSRESRMKTLSYAGNILAAREAQAAGTDEALMLNSVGRAACFTIGNIVLSIDGELVTPPISDGALPGILRARLISRHGLAERPLTLEDWRRADAACLVNSLRLIRPLAGRGDFGPLLDAICRCVSADSGVDPRKL